MDTEIDGQKDGEIDRYINLIDRLKDDDIYMFSFIYR